jgi:putative PIN family toxin of toxin-antitoxin system
MNPKIVIDTNVLIAGLKSRRGASFRILELIGEGKFELAVSVPLVLEYEEAAKRRSRILGLAYTDIEDILDYICKAGDRREIFYLWRPFLKDPNDDMLLELAVEANCDFIVTHNIKDFAGVERFGVQVLTPRELLKRIGEI